MENLSNFALFCNLDHSSWMISPSKSQSFKSGMFQKYNNEDDSSSQCSCLLEKPDTWFPSWVLIAHLRLSILISKYWNQLFSFPPSLFLFFLVINQKKKCVPPSILGAYNFSLFFISLNQTLELKTSHKGKSF